MKVVILAGGISTERDVSLSSGSMIYKALKKKGHQAVILDVYLGYAGRASEIFELDCDWSAAIGGVSETKPDLEAVRRTRMEIERSMKTDGSMETAPFIETGGERNFFGPNVLAICQSADAVFLALHGANGEDGKIQACFELMGIPYTGTDYVSSAMAMDKGITKDIFRAYHIPTPAGIRLKAGEKEKERVPYPCIVKSCCGGSSVGVCIANNDAEYEAAKEEAFRYDSEVIIEQYIQGREFSVAVMDGKALPVIEIAPKQGFYDYKNKYQPGSTVETCPADIPEEKALRMQRISEDIFKVMRMKNYARMDFMMDERGEVFCLETNTLPGMTPTSLLPQEAEAIGIGFDELCERILQYAVKHFRKV